MVYKNGWHSQKCTGYVRFEGNGLCIVGTGFMYSRGRTVHRNLSQTKGNSKVGKRGKTATQPYNEIDPPSPVQEHSKVF